jgi:hypothetical protein
MEILPSFLNLFLDADKLYSVLAPLVQSQAAIGAHHNPLFYIFFLF